MPRDIEPVWSPDGMRIAFASRRVGTQEIYAMTASGAKQTNLTNNAAFDFAPDRQPRRRT